MWKIIKFEDEQGKKGFIAVETKYSENLGTNAAYKKDESGKKIPRSQCVDAIKMLQCFTSDAEKSIMENNEQENQEQPKINDRMKFQEPNLRGDER